MVKAPNTQQFNIKTATTTMTALAAPTHVDTTVNYFPREGGITTYLAGSAEFWNRKFDPTNVCVKDIRGKESEYTLDTQGFQLVEHMSQQVDFKDKERINNFYYRETEDLVKRM
jgi:hypothetical protein